MMSRMNFNFRSMFSAADMRRSRKFSRGRGGSSFGPWGILQFYHFKTHTLGNRGGGGGGVRTPLDPGMTDVLLKHFQSRVG